MCVVPRKQWDQKNPYCWRSKLTTEAFEHLAFTYFMEVTSGGNRNKYVHQLKSGANGFSITRQTLSRYFDMISQYIWDNMILPTSPEYQDKNSLNPLLDFVYGNVDCVPKKYNVIYKYLDDLPVKSNDPDLPVQRTLMFHLLLKRSKALRGFPKEQFYLEFSRIFFMCAVVEAKGMDMSRNDNFHDYFTKKEIHKVAYSALIKILRKNPL